MIKLLRESEFVNKFNQEIYPFKFSMRYIEAGKNSIIQLKYSVDRIEYVLSPTKYQLENSSPDSDVSESLVAIVECLYKNDKLLTLIIRSVEPKIVKLFIELYSVRNYSYVFIYNYHASKSYYTDIIKAYELGNYYSVMPKNTKSIKLLMDNIFHLYNDDSITPKIRNYHIIMVSYVYDEYWKDKIDFLLGLAEVVIIGNHMYFRNQEPKNISNRSMWYYIALFLETLNRKTSTKSARKIMPI